MLYDTTHHEYFVCLHNSYHHSHSPETLACVVPFVGVEEGHAPVAEGDHALEVGGMEIRVAVDGMGGAVGGAMEGEGDTVVRYWRAGDPCREMETCGCAAVHQ